MKEPFNLWQQQHYCVSNNALFAHGILRPFCLCLCLFALLPLPFAFFITIVHACRALPRTAAHCRTACRRIRHHHASDRRLCMTCSGDRGMCSYSCYLQISSGRSRQMTIIGFPFLQDRSSTILSNGRSWCWARIVVLSATSSASNGGHRQRIMHRISLWL